ncbi:competence type IV pilus minor pilin ComGD [Bacillus tianshenii]|nr:competence type IV pilus minor pilin ComGD [Bacillus tianshenii]
MFHNTQRGFTLIEMIIVLSVLTTVTFVSLIYFEPVFEQKRHEFFLEQLQRDFLYAQSYAINNNTDVFIHIVPYEHRYIVKEGLTNKILTRDYAENIEISRGTLGYMIKFLPSGNARKSGALYIKLGDEHYNLIVLLGKGRLYVKKL